jgi:hypothetical protein
MGVRSLGKEKAVAFVAQAMTHKVHKKKNPALMQKYFFQVSGNIGCAPLRVISW